MVFHVPSAYLQEFALVFEEVFHLKISTSRIHEIFQANGINRKKLQKEAKERNTTLRDHWYMKLAHWTAPQLVFIDESGINTKLGERTHGYSTKGKVIRAKVSPGRAENFSLLPALSIDGYFACKLYRGSINAERFTEFIEQEVLPKCKPYPGPRSVIIMDNASIHRAEELRPIIEAKNCRLEFLPPYSPDFNPIEYSFSVIKSALKGNYQLRSDEDFDQMELKVKQALREKVTPQVAANQYRHCKIRMVT